LILKGKKTLDKSMTYEGKKGTFFIPIWNKDITFRYKEGCKARFVYINTTYSRIKMDYRKEITERYKPTEGQIFYIYRTFSGKLIALPYKTTTAELLRTIKWVA